MFVWSGKPIGPTYKEPYEEELLPNPNLLLISYPPIQIDS